MRAVMSASVKALKKELRSAVRARLKALPREVQESRTHLNSSEQKTTRKETVRREKGVYVVGPSWSWGSERGGAAR